MRGFGPGVPIGGVKRWQRLSGPRPPQGRPRTTDKSCQARQGGIQWPGHSGKVPTSLMILKPTGKDENDVYHGIPVSTGRKCHAHI